MTEVLLVESYRAAGDPVAPLGALEGDEVRILAALAVPGDEVVFYLVRATSTVDVRLAFEANGIASVRIVPAEWVAVGPGRLPVVETPADA